MLKNYTSDIHPDVTISRIERLLVNAGATGITKHYGLKGECVAIVFEIVFKADTPPVKIRLPAEIAKCQESLWRDYSKSSIRGRKTKEDFAEQATRTSWKLVQDWVEVQVSLIHLRQIEFMQAFLSYLWDEQRQITYYQHFNERGFKAFLPERTSNE